MRNRIDWLLLIVLVLASGYGVYTHAPQARGVVRMVQESVASCSQPITYSIGVIDPRFRVSTTTLISDLGDAESVWEDPTHKNMYQYIPSGGEVTVSLIFDNRQASTNKLAAENTKIGTSQSAYDALKVRYDALAAQVSRAQSRFAQATNTYRTHEASYNAAVDAANQRGGASASEYAALQAQKSAVASEFAQLKQLESATRSDVDALNTLATQLNQQIAQLNLHVNQYNQVGAGIGEFEEGQYQLQNGVQTIDVYEFSNHVQLVRVLAHELGHARGLEHVADPEAIMYELNSGKHLTPTEDDLAELARVCRTAH